MKLKIAKKIASWFRKKAQAIASFWRRVKLAIWRVVEKYIVTPYRVVAFFFNKYLWSPIRKVFMYIGGKFSYWSWKLSPGRSSEHERERYKLFIESLGGWNNISAFTCRSKSWHLKIIHSFLINWENLALFNLKVLNWSWPHLDLSLGSYSRWIFKRLRRFTKMPKLEKVKMYKYR